MVFARRQNVSHYADIFNYAKSLKAKERNIYIYIYICIR